MIEESDGETHNRIPFLAGQDWLAMMRAVIDLDKDELELRALQVKVPLLIDHSGHMVIAIDEYPSAGWPPGLTTQLDEYPGAIFSATRPIKDYTDTGALSAYEERAASGVKPNFNYEPNDDDMNTNIPRGPCSVQPDFWEFDYVHGLVVRHHHQPRFKLFHPSDVIDGPQQPQLRDERVTVIHGSGEDLRDNWKTSQLPGPNAAWTGMTCFFLNEAQVGKVEIPKPHVQHGVHVLHAELGTRHWVHPSSLYSIGKKKILQFDLGASTRVFEHAPSAKQQSFEIPPKQFGSAIVQQRGLQRQHARAMAASGQQDDQVVANGRKLVAVQHDDPRDETSRTRTHGLHRERAHGGDVAADRAIDGATLNDSSSGSDTQSFDGGIPRVSNTLSALGGACKTSGEQARQVLGVPELRNHQESLDPGLQPPDHQR